MDQHSPKRRPPQDPRSPKSFKSNEIVSSIYKRSKTAVYQKLLSSQSPKQSGGLVPMLADDGQFSYYYSSRPGTNESRFRKITEIGPSKDSPASFYFYKRRDQSIERTRNAKLEDVKHNPIKLNELSKLNSRDKLKSASPRARLNIHKHHAIGETSREAKVPLTKDLQLKLKLKRIQLEEQNEAPDRGPTSPDSRPRNLKETTRRSQHLPSTQTHFTQSPRLPNLALDLSKTALKQELLHSTNYNSKLQSIITACEGLPPSHDITHKVSLEQKYLAKVNRQLEWTTAMIDRFQDSDAPFLASMFEKMEADKVDFLAQHLEAIQYFKFFSNCPSKQLEMVVKMLKRKKNVVL